MATILMILSLLLRSGVNGPTVHPMDDQPNCIIQQTCGTGG